MIAFTMQSDNVLAQYLARRAGFLFGEGHPADASLSCLASVVHTFEAIGSIWGSMSAPVVSRVMGELNKNSKKYRSSSSFVSFTQFSPTCGRMPLPALSLWPGRQPCRPRLVDGRRGGGPSSVAPRSRNPPTGHHRDSPISSSLFSHGPCENNIGEITFRGGFF